MWKVIIADDEKLICRLIETLIDWKALDMEIVGKAENGLEALRMVKELRPHALDGGPWVYQDSPIMHFDEEAARRFDDALPPMEKRVLPCQEEFYILSNSVLR